jgi:CRP/FNR family cyclic AMP-dependent transcriptional regulator
VHAGLTGLAKLPPSNRIQRPRIADIVRLRQRIIEEQESQEGNNVRGSYGVDMGTGYHTCTRHRPPFFCQMSPKAMKDFRLIASDSAYPEGAILFIENQDPRGVFALSEGDVKLTICSSEGKTLILRIARPGDILGLMAVFSNKPYEVTAETLHPCHIIFVCREDFLRFLAKHTDAYPIVVERLSADYRSVCEQLRTVGLSGSARAKLAKLLLDWSAAPEHMKDGASVTLPLTHEEIAEFIGSSRETVTRTLRELKNRGLIALEGSTLIIPSRATLEGHLGSA